MTTDDFDLYGGPAKQEPPESAGKLSNNGVAEDQLRAFCERLERLSDEKKAIAEDIKQVKAEAKGSGFDIGTLNEMLKLRAMDQAARYEREALRDLYGHALGIFG